MKSGRSLLKNAVGLTLCAALCSLSLQADPVRLGFNSNTLYGNDDSYVGPVGLGFNVDFFGRSTSSVYVNNNGNVTFSGGLSTFTPFDLLSTATPIIAPFFADVDTRGSTPVTYGTGTVGSNLAFGVNWLDVGYYSYGSPTNSFQLVMIDRSDLGVGNFDFEFNYNTIRWETGGASGGSGGLGGSSARVGWSNGSTDSFELAGSAVNGAFLNGGSNALITNSLNSGVDGRYIFNVRNGVVQGVPDTASSAMLLILGALLLSVAQRRFRA